MPKQTALILGGTHGLGAAIADECLEKGWTTLVVGRTIGISKPNQLTLPCDLSSIGSVTQFLKTIGPNLSEIDHFFWVAGVLLDGKFAENEPDEFERLIDINLKNPLRIVQQIWQSMILTTTPKTFTAISSTTATKVRDSQAVYALSKAGQYHFVQCLAAENTNENLKVSVFRPGGMKTQFYDTYPNVDYEKFLDPQKVAHLILTKISRQKEPFLDLEIPRGSLR